MQSPYETLQVSSTATSEEIKEAYLRLRAQVAASNLEESQTASSIKELEDAYALLSDPNSRDDYDSKLMATGSNSESKDSLSLIQRPVTSLSPVAPQPAVERLCPHCGSPNPIQASMCSHCGQQMTRPCPNCGQAVQLDQQVCPRCNTVMAEYDQRRLAQALIAEQKMTTERLESESQSQTLAAGHRGGTVRGVVFWIFAIVGCIALGVIPFLVFDYILKQP
jgi:DnaJ-class molecular chaperone